MESFNDSAHKHAVTHLGGSQKLWHDAWTPLAATTSDINGDYRLAASGGLTCTPGCSCSLHIEEMDSNGYPAVSSSSSSGGTPTSARWITFTWRTSGTYSGNNFVLSRVSKRLSTYGSIWRSYYPGAMRVEGDPTRNNNGVQYMLTDHLGSTSVTVHLKSNHTPEKRAELRYMPWGENRASGYAESSTPTDRRYTGQIKEDIGLYFYNARWYDASLGRMAQADTVMPGTHNPLAFDKYSYVFNSPLGKIDPSGHRPCDDQDENGQCISNPGWGKKTRSPEYVNPNELTQTGKKAYQVYLELWNDKSGWWWDSPLLGGDSQFSIQDFVTIILYIELDLWYNIPDLLAGFSEAMVRSFYGWAKEMERKYPGKFATGATSAGLINWIFAQSGVSRNTPIEFAGNTPVSAVKIAQVIVKTIMNPIKYNHAEWAIGKVGDRPWSIGSHTPNGGPTLPYNKYLVTVDKCQHVYAFFGNCTLDEGFSFMLTGDLADYWSDWQRKHCRENEQGISVCDW